MKFYTHTEMPGTFGTRGVRMPDGVWHPRSWFRTASAQAISAAGFRVYTPPELDPVPPPAPSAHLVASGVFTVEEGWLEGVGAAAGIGMAFAADVGTYWLMFSDPQPDLAYAAPASSSEGQINVQRFLDYVEITVRDGTGALIDPAEFSITITRTL